MKVAADRTICMGAGSCKQLAGEVFDQDEQDGIVILRVEHPSKESEAAVRNAVKCCPSGAISLIDD